MAGSGSKKSLAKVLVVTLDEYDLIEDWIAYHGAIFGFDSLVVIDNGSTDPRVHEVYARYASRGVTVVSDTQSFGGGGQGVVTTRHMLHWKDTCEWLIPLDTDEFLIAERDIGSDQPDLDSIRRNIQDRLRDVPPQTTCLVVRHRFESVVDPTAPHYVDQKMERPARTMTTFARDPHNTYKSIFRSDAFQRVDPGNHSGATAYGSHEVDPVLAHISFHFTGARRLFERARTHVKELKYADVGLSSRDQVAHVQPLLSHCVYAIHRLHEYYRFVLADFLADLHLQSKGCLPTPEQMEQLLGAYRHTPPAHIERDFPKAGDADVDPEAKHRLVYHDPPLPPNVHNLSVLSKILCSS